MQRENLHLFKKPTIFFFMLADIVPLLDKSLPRALSIAIEILIQDFIRSSVQMADTVDCVYE